MLHRDADTLPKKLVAQAPSLCHLAHRSRSCVERTIDSVQDTGTSCGFTKKRPRIEARKRLSVEKMR